MGRKNIQRVSNGYHYFFVKPGDGMNADATARRIMEIGPVGEVLVTEGEYGFVVRASGSVQDGEALLARINRASRGTSRRVMCHCRYSSG